jgi:hypothetical protein
MNLDLDSLKTEILEHLSTEGFVIFHGYSRLSETDSFVAWDTDHTPDFRVFLSAAQGAGIRLIVFHRREFTAAHIEDASDRLEASNVTVEEQRTMERRLRALKAYEGFTCAIELSFDHQGRVYLFSLRSEWYEDYLDLLEQIEASMPDDFDDDDEDDGSMGGYYSRN